MFSEVFPVFHMLYPDIRFHTKELRNKRMEQALLNKEVDLACLTFTEGQQDPRFSYIASTKEEIVLGVPASHPLAYLAGENSAERLPEVDLSLFKDTQFLLAAPETKSSDIEAEIFRTADFQPKILYTSSGSKTRIREGTACLCVLSGILYRSESTDRVLYGETAYSLVFSGGLSQGKLSIRAGTRAR